MGETETGMCYCTNWLYGMSQATLRFISLMGNWRPYSKSLHASNENSNASSLMMSFV